MAAADGSPHGFETEVGQSARVWNYWLGGTDNYQIDREAGDQLAEGFPAIVQVARVQRVFLKRVVRYLVHEAGVRQFLDIGSGLPTAENTHQIAQAAAPDCRVVYVDNDPMVLTHARELLVGTLEGATEYVEADIHDTAGVLAAAARTLEFTRPIALILCGILGHIPDDEVAASLVRELMDALPSGSYLVINDGCSDNPDRVAAQDRYDDTGAAPYHLRSQDEFAALFTGFELVDPGVVPSAHWHPDTPVVESPADTAVQGGLARKP